MNGKKKLMVPAEAGDVWIEKYPVDIRQDDYEQEIVPLMRSAMDGELCPVVMAVGRDNGKLQYFTVGYIKKEFRKEVRVKSRKKAVLVSGITKATTLTEE